MKFESSVKMIPCLQIGPLQIDLKWSTFWANHLPMKRFGGRVRYQKDGSVTVLFSIMIWLKMIQLEISQLLYQPCGWERMWDFKEGKIRSVKRFNGLAD